MTGAVALVLVASACTPTSSDESASATGGAIPAVGATTTSPGERGATDVSQGGVPDGVPPISGLVAAQPIVAPGDTVTFTGSALLSGSLRLMGPDGDEAAGMFSDGRGSVSLDVGATEGEWGAVVTSETWAIAVGVVEVARGPSLLLVADRTRVVPGDAVTVTLYSARLPDDVGVLFGWGNLDWSAYFEDEEDDGEEPLGVLVPDDNGLLQVGTEPVPLGDVAGVPILMSGMEMAGLQAMAISDAESEVYLSNPVPLEECSMPAVLRGSIGGPGVVHLVSFGDGLRSAAADAADGTFSLGAPHGPTAVFAARDDGTVFDPVRIDLACAGTVDVDLVSGSIQTAGQAGTGDAAESEEGSAPPDGGTVTLTGDLETTFEVEPVCQYRRESIGIIFATYDDDLPAVQLEIPGGDTSGTHQGTVEVTDWTSGTSPSIGAAEVTIEYAPGVRLAEAEMIVTGEFAGPSGTGVLEGSFACIVTGVIPPAPGTTTTEPPSVQTADDPLTEAQPTSFDTPGPDPSTVAAACRTIVVDDGRDPQEGVRVAASLRSGLPRATVVALSELRAVFERGDRGQVAGSWGILDAVPALAGASPDILVRLDGFSNVTAAALPGAVVPDRGEEWAVAGSVDDVVDALAGRVLCVDVDPIDVASGASESIIVNASDLTGTPIPSASVTIGPAEFGTIASQVTELINGVARVLYTGGPEAGQEALTIEVGGGEYWPTRVLANVAAGFGYLLEGQYRIELTPVGDDAPVPGGPLSATLVAASCTGRSGPWDGLLVLEAGPVLTMMAIAGAAGEIGEGVFGPPTFPGAASKFPLPDIGLLMIEAYGMEEGNPAILASRLLAVQDDPYRPIVMGVTFTLPRSGSTPMAVEGRTSGYSLRVSPARRNVVQLTAQATHLLNAVIERTSCLSGDDVLERAWEIVPDIEG